MIDFPRPQPLTNPIFDTQPLSPWELLAGPLGVLAFLPLIPMIRIAAARAWRDRRATLPAHSAPFPERAEEKDAGAPSPAVRTRLSIGLIASAVIWSLVTTGPIPTAMLAGGLAAAAAWIVALGTLRDRGRLGRRTMIAFVWIGLHALMLPLWWVSYPSWYHSRMAVMHALGFSYLMLRMIAWGVDWANQPHQPLRPRDTIAWLAYVPCMRAGPVMLRSQFLQRFDAWSAARPNYAYVASRLISGLAGLALMAVTWKNTTHVVDGAADFFAAPELYPTRQLLRALYLIPLQIYLFIWSYNEIAIGSSIWLGIPADENFYRLPQATSVRDFWRRWHITLGVWLRSYIYIPIGGNRGLFGLGHALTPLNYVVVFLYVAVWHGACWAFVVWALLQAFALGVHSGWDALRNRLNWGDRPNGPIWTALCWLLTFNYQCATIVLLSDFQYAGSRFFPVLFRRLAALGA